MDRNFNLVTGGAGFIGTNLCEYLMRHGTNVLVIDDLCSGSERNVRHLEDVARETGVEFIFIQEGLEYYTGESFRSSYYIPYDVQLDCIYHLACPASPNVYMKYPLYTLNTCINGTSNVIDLALDQQCPMLLTSTSEVYGDPDVHPQPENYVGRVNFRGTRSCYDEGKRVAETLMYLMKSNMFKTVRIFNTFGPHMDPNDGRFISNFINQILDDKPLTIYGDGSQTRSICFVDDIVRGLVAMMNSSSAGPINLGNPVELTVLEWGELISDICGVPLRTEFMLPMEDDPKRRCPDITKAKNVLRWEPKYDIRKGLEVTIAYYKRLRDERK